MKNLTISKLIITCVLLLIFSNLKAQYCTPSTSCTAFTPDYITNVNFAGINRSSTCDAATGGYSNWGAPFIATVIQGQTYPISVTTGAGGGDIEEIAVWIDYNNNQVFASNELVFQGALGTTPAIYLSNIAIPMTATAGQTRMRVRCKYNTSTTPTLLNTDACTNYTFGETEDYLVNIISASPHDPAVFSLTTPTGNCFTNCETVSVNITNYGSQNINLASNNVTVNLHLNGVIVASNVLNSGTLNANSGNTNIVNFPCLNLYAGGNYSFNTTISIGNAGGVVNGNFTNDSLANAIVLNNYRPTPGADLHVCQNSPIGFGQGLTATGCTTTIHDSIDITFTINPSCIDNLGATTTGTSQTIPGAACGNVYVGLFGTATVPTLITNSPIFIQNAKLEVTNLGLLAPATLASEVRFNIYKGPNNPIPNTVPSPVLAPITQGLAGNSSITQTGITTTNSSGIGFSYKREITAQPSVVAYVSSLMSQPGSTINLGYFESWNDAQNSSDIAQNVGGTTTAKLRIYFDYVPGTINWYDNATSNVILDTLVPFNPFSLTGWNSTTQLTNTSVAGTYPFYVSCTGSNCRVPVNLVIDPTPSVCQDTLSLCENAPSSNQAVFDLCSMSGAVSCFAPGVSVSFYQDQSLFSLIQTCLDTTSTAVIYTQITNSFGCSSSDSLLLIANSLPEFSSSVYVGTACTPTSYDVVNTLYYSSVPNGTDTLYYEDMACTIPHTNPHAITVADTVYVVFKTNTIPACTDTAVAYIYISPAQNLIANQVTPGNYSSQGSIPPVTFNFNDGVTHTYYQSIDCKKVATITDLTNGLTLGNTVVNEDINNSSLPFNNQPYVNRVYQITPTTQDSAEVCLYYLEDDIQTYNGNSGIFPFMNSTNFTITQTHNGPAGAPGSTFTVIPNSAITSSYDAASTVWTLCFKVDSFSYFYLHTQNPNNAALPISLLSFTGKRVENTSLLKWSTTAEQNNAYFEIERSKDARNFNVVSDKIATKAINGNSNAMLNYVFTDMIPNEGHNYYRLKQTDKDGKTSNAKNVVDVYFGEETMVALYPNPAHNELNIDINISKATNAKMKIMDATGRVVKQIEMQLKSGGNQTKVSLDGLSDGMYMVNITNEKGLNYSQTIRKN